MIQSCFADMVVIRDVCGIVDTKRVVSMDYLVDRSCDFWTLHPEAILGFHYVSEEVL